MISLFLVQPGTIWNKGEIKMERYFTVRVELVEHLNMDDTGSNEEVVLTHNIHFARYPGKSVKIDFRETEFVINDYFVQEDNKIRNLARREEILRQIESLNRELESL